MKPILLLLFLLLIPIPVNAVTYCDGDALKENISVNDVIITISNVACDFGCLNNTLSTLGHSGCVESDLSLWITLLGAVIILATLFKVINK